MRKTWFVLATTIWNSFISGVISIHVLSGYLSLKDTPDKDMWEKLITRTNLSSWHPAILMRYNFVSDGKIFLKYATNLTCKNS